jgi:hypothetical protein
VALSQIASRLQNQAKLDLARSEHRTELLNFCQRVTSTNQNTVFPSSQPLHSITQMASRTFSRALRSPLAKQLSAPARRTFVSALKARPTAARTVAAAQQVRGVKTIDFAGTKEQVYGEYLKLLIYDYV